MSPQFWRRSPGGREPNAAAATAPSPQVKPVGLKGKKEPQKLTPQHHRKKYTRTRGYSVRRVYVALLFVRIAVMFVCPAVGTNLLVNNVVLNSG